MAGPCREGRGPREGARSGPRETSGRREDGQMTQETLFHTPNDPSEPRRLTLYDRGEIAMVLWTLILHRGQAPIEDAYDDLRADPAPRHVGPAAIEIFRLQHPECGIIGSARSRRESRKGGTLDVWGGREEMGKDDWGTGAGVVGYFREWGDAC